MIDYTVLKFLWWVILGCILIVYATTAGFDIGITTIMPFFKRETDRRVILNVSAPTWDGNLTWIMFAGGGLFVVWPVVYSTAFSGMYAAMLLVLFPHFLRPPGYEYRNKVDSHRWRRMWDVGLFLSGVVPVFIFGVATGNCFLGFPFHFDTLSMREFYTGDFWGLLNPLGILSGIVSVCMVLLHGATYMQRRTEGRLRETARKIVFYAGGSMLFFFTISGLLIVFRTPGYHLLTGSGELLAQFTARVLHKTTGGWFDSYFQYPWKFYPPAAAYIGIVLAMATSYFRSVKFAFWWSALAVAGTVGTAGFTLFPFIMPSSTNPDQSLTMWNAVSSQYALNIMFYVGTVLLFVILAYKIFAYHSIWGKKSTITEEDLKENEHTFY